MVVPEPVRQQSGSGHWIVPSPATIACHGQTSVAAALQAALQDRFHISSQIGGDSSNSDIVLSVQPALPQLQEFMCRDEGYELSVSQDTGVRLAALTPCGLFYGVQTLLQLVQRQADGSYAAPAVQVLDAPRFRWRGVLLDVGRHFFSVPFIKKVLDMMALHKMNRFHWHLTEDQGWRLEIKGLPRLTEVGAWRGTGDNVYGGFYTQEQVRELVAYAADRFIQVVPEIELPGHCCAALASYNYLSCTEAVSEVPTQWGIHEDVYCAGKEEVFHFLEHVLCEVVELFPFEYIHIGGDECPKTRWMECEHCQARIAEEQLLNESELQSWFIRRMSAFLLTKGRHIVGWDEILEGGLAEGATVMSWRGVMGGLIAAKAGHDVLMTPTSHCYFDFRQAPSPSEPGAWYACLPLKTVYEFDPVPPQPQRRDEQHKEQQLLQQRQQQAGVLEQQQQQLQEEEQRQHEQEQDSATVASRGVQQPDPSRPTANGLPEAAAGGNSASRGAAAAEGTSGVGAGSAEGQEQQQDEHEQQEEQQPATLHTSRSVEDMEGLVLSDSVPSTSDVVMESGSSPTTPPSPDPPSPTHKQPRLSPADIAHIKGGQANLWTEYVGDEATAEYMLLPRLCAMAEALWSPPEVRGWEGFRARLDQHVPMLESLGYRGRPLDA